MTMFKVISSLLHCISVTCL